MRFKSWVCCGLGLIMLVGGVIQGQEEKRYVGKTAKEWIKIVKDKNAPQRKDGVEVLMSAGRIMAMEVGTEEVVAALVSALDDKEEFLRARAARGIGNFHAEAKSAVPALIKAMKATSKAAEQGGEEFARIHFLEALGDIGPSAKAAVPVVLHSLKDAEPRIRKKAAESLQMIDPEAAKKAGIK